MTDFILKRNDTVPIEAELKDEDGTAENLTGDTVRFLMRTTDGTVIVDGTATIENESDGVVAYYWTQTDTEQAGRFQAEFEVTHNDGTTDEYVETYPRDGYIDIQILEDIA